ncbi:MAG: fimbrial protein [Bacteroides cellulosilyticus]|nr:fimbrial protein [Bacteroides cellulosilyticus]
MKRILFATIAFAILLASCDKINEPIVPIPVDADGSRVRITLTDAHDTRTFFDDTATAETWEKALSSLTVFTFDEAGTLILRRDFTAEELTAKSATFALPKSASGKACAFYAIANYNVPAVQTRAELLALVERAIVDYNGTFADVSSQALRSEGFVMSGMTAQTVGEVNSITHVGITLKRTVAKIAVRTSVDPAFGQKYGGTLRIDSVTLSKGAAQTSVIAGSAPTTGTMNYTHTQVSATASGKYDNLFYLFENGPLAAGNRVLAEIRASYDMDGDTSTVDDISEVVYSVELTGAGDGGILRNGYYRIEIDITGLVGQDCAVSVSVADWESPFTQSIELGA